MLKKYVLALVVLAAGALPLAAQDKRELTVEELFNLVETNSSSLQLQKTGVQFADQGVAAAKTERLPDISTSLSVAYNGNVLMTDRDLRHAHGYSVPHLGNSFSVEAQQVIYAGGAVEAGIEMATLRKHMAAAGEEATRQQLRFLALGHYLDLLKLGHRMQVYEQNIALTERLLSDIRAKHEQGMALKNDITRYELQLESQRLALRKVADSRAIENQQLCTLLGLSGVELVPDETILPTADKSSNEAEWQQTALQNSPTLLQARVGTEMARQDVRLAKSSLLPKVNLFAAESFSGPFTYDIPPIDKNVNFWQLGLGVSYSLSSLFKGKAKVAQAITALSQRQQELTVTSERLADAMQEAWTLYNQAFAEHRTQVKSVELARLNYQVMNDRYLSQLSLITDMIDASNVKLNAELQEVDARINIVFHFLRLKYVSGTL